MIKKTFFILSVLNIATSFAAAGGNDTEIEEGILARLRSYRTEGKEVTESQEQSKRETLTQKQAKRKAILIQELASFGHEVSLYLSLEELEVAHLAAIQMHSGTKLLTGLAGRMAATSPAELRDKWMGQSNGKAGGGEKRGQDGTKKESTRKRLQRLHKMRSTGE